MTRAGSLPVLLAVEGAPWEADLVSAIEHAAGPLSVLRRCVDLPDLLAAGSSGIAEAALVSANLRRLDRDALVRLAASGLGVVGLVGPGEEEAERRLRQLGVGRVVAADCGVSRLAATVAEAVAAAGAGPGSPPGGGPGGDHGYADPLAALSQLVDERGPGDDEATAVTEGRLVAVWGPTGAPGRTTVAVTLAAELAVLGVDTLLADADTYGGSVAQTLGLLDEAPGLAAAARLANTGSLDVAALARVARSVAPRLRVLTGITRADRWPELRGASLESVWAAARRLAAVTVVDCGFCLERDEEISFDTAAPRRNAATLTTLEVADTVVAVGAADPVGVSRLVRGLDELRETVPGAPLRVLVNRVRRGAVGADPERQLAVALDRYAGVESLLCLPDDQESCDRALAAGRTLGEVASDSALRRSVAGLAADLAGRTLPQRGRRRRQTRRRVSRR